MRDKQIARAVSARDAVESIRGSMTNVEVMRKFKLKPSAYADLLRQLFEERLITEADLERRGIRFKVKKKQVAIVQVEQAPPRAVEASEDFLDTDALTELLAFITPGKPSPSSAPEEASPVESSPPRQGGGALQPVYDVRPRKFLP